MSKLRLAVVGVGHLGKIHARLLAERDDVLLVGVADSDAANRAEVAAACHTAAVADYHDLVDEVDAAIIATPTYTHRDVALAFLNRGLHVLVEKPLAGSVREADDLVAAARRRKAVLQVGHVERFNPALVAAEPYLEQPRFIEATRVGPFTARSTDIGAVLDLMIHDIDLMLHLVGSHVRNVFAMGQALLGRHEDVANARLEFENGCVAHLGASRIHVGAPRRQMQVWGHDCFADIDFAARTARVVTPSSAVRRHEIDVAAMSVAERIALRDSLHETHLRASELAVEPRNAVADQHQDFLESIRTGREPRAGGAVGRDALVVAERVLAGIQAHLWGERANRSTPPDSPPPVLRGPHWPMLNQPQRARRQAG
ncbi:MAG TPA: Gfo/Idh/MocA family oxidoreductase [Pirellulales bacterium]|nr:Gfo/Idh/MocA family oxidoreductase [Pirellulales bacterium]